MRLLKLSRERMNCALLRSKIGQVELLLSAEYNSDFGMP
jgi:hypothetical protein